MAKPTKKVFLNEAVKPRWQELTAIMPQLHESYHALEWLLSHFPFLGYQSEDYGEGMRLYIQAADHAKGMLEIWVIYTITGDDVEILALDVFPSYNGIKRL